MIKIQSRLIADGGIDGQSKWMVVVTSEHGSAETEFTAPAGYCNAVGGARPDAYDIMLELINNAQRGDDVAGANVSKLGGMDYIRRFVPREY